MVHDTPSPDDRPPITHSEADETSQTRFGPRPVPEGHRHPAGPSESRRIPPHGDVSPDGRRVWPRPSPTAKWLVWGGTALAAAAVTAGTVIAARGLVDAVSGSRHRRGPERSMAPRFAELSPEERAAMRRRVRERDAEDAHRLAGLRAEAEASAGTRAAQDAQDRPRRRPAAPRPSLMQEVEANTASLQNGLENTVRALDSAMRGFRSVAGQASGILREFDGAAGLIRGLFGCGGSDPAPGARTRARRQTAAHEAPMPDLRDDPLTHDPLDGPDEAEGPADQNPRLHRL